MKLFIPVCGDRLVLIKPWSFDLYAESRNINFAKAMKLVDEDYFIDWRRPYDKFNVKLPAGTVLECDRVYIRSFNKSAIKTEDDYDSITWKVIKNGKAVRRHRFWAKLKDCNKINYKLETDSLYRDRVKTIKEIIL